MTACQQPPRSSAAASSEVQAAGYKRHLTWSPAQQLQATKNDLIISTANNQRRGLLIQNLDPLRGLLVNFGFSAATAGLVVPPLSFLSWTSDDTPTGDIHVANPVGGHVNFIFIEGIL